MAVAETLAPLIVSVIKWVTFQLAKTRIDDGQVALYLSPSLSLALSLDRVACRCALAQERGLIARTGYSISQRWRWRKPLRQAQGRLPRFLRAGGRRMRGGVLSGAEELHWVWAEVG